MSELSQYLKAERESYLYGEGATGGTAENFRKRIAKKAKEEPAKFEAMVLDAWMEASTRAWQKPPKRRDPDMFSIGGMALPEFFVRRRMPETWDEEDDSSDPEAMDQFLEKVHCDFATVADAYADATIKMRKAAQASAAAEEDMKLADLARRRSRGRLEARLVELVDPPRKAAA
jgi:hypothetical protein